MLSECSTIWANPPTAKVGFQCSTGPRVILKTSIEMHFKCPELIFDEFLSNYGVLIVIWIECKVFGGNCCFFKKVFYHLRKSFVFRRQCVSWTCGAMDNASDYGSEDSRFESWQVRKFLRVYLLPRQLWRDKRSLEQYDGVLLLYLCGRMSWMKVRTQDSYRVPLSENLLENPGIDPGTSHMLSERSTIWANPPDNMIRTLNQSHLEPRGQAHMDGQLMSFDVTISNSVLAGYVGKVWPVYKSPSCIWTCGAMDNASDYGSEDSRLESWQGRIFAW